MKKFYALIVVCLICCAFVNAQTRYWRLAPGTTGDWDNPNNWSATSGGPSSGDFPNGTTYNVIFDRDALVRIDIDNITLNTLSVLSLKTVKLFVDNPPSGSSTITAHSTDNLNPALKIELNGRLEDSCVTNSLFTFTFALGAKGIINGTWYFSGSNNVVDDTKGPTFLVPKDIVGSNHPRVDVNGTIQFKNKTYIPQGEIESLFFNSGSVFWLDRNGGTNPNAVWDSNSTIKITGVTTVVPSITVATNPGEIGHLVFDCPNVASDLSMLLTRRLIMKGNFQFLNTNNQKIIIATTTGAFVDYTVLGNFEVSGPSSVIFANPSIDKAYSLIVLGNFNLSGGTFSLRNDPLSGPVPLNQPTTLLLRGNFNHTGGAFAVNNTATSTGVDLFIVELNGTSAQTITSVSGTIDNAANQVTLRMNNAAGATLMTPLSVGKIDFNTTNKGRLFTTNSSILTINNTGTGSLVVNTPGNAGHVNGPLIRKTASNAAYLSPTGKGGTFRYSEVIPGDASPSAYKAEYHNLPYPDLSVIYPLAGVSNVEYWEISKISGANAAVRLNLAGSVPGAAVDDAIYVGRYNGLDWVSTFGTFITPGNASTGNATSDILSEFGAFTFGFTNPSNIICPGGNTSFTMTPPGSGYTYQWQVNTGSGFENTVDGGVYSDANTNTLNLTNVPSSYYGYQYRCVATNGGSTVYSSTRILKFSVSWTGVSNTAWENTANWSCGILPDQYTDVIINGGTANQPRINSNVSCRSVFLSTGSILTVQAGFNLELKGQPGN